MMKAELSDSAAKTGKINRMCGTLIGVATVSYGEMTTRHASSQKA